MTESASLVATKVAFGEALVELGLSHPDVVVLDADLANSTCADMFADRLPNRFLEMGIAEQNMIGVAAGLACVGLIPFAVGFAAFMSCRDLDQIRVSIAQPRLHVVVVGAYSGLLVGGGGKTHVCLEDLAILRSMPNMVVLAPADATETRQAVFAAANHNGPIYMRLTRNPSPLVFGPDYRFSIGPGVVLRTGTDVALLSTGVQTTRALDAAEALQQEGISACVLHLPTVKPLDDAAVLEAARSTGAVVTTEDHSIIGGLGSAVAELLSERLPTPIRRVGTRDVFAESGSDEALLEKYGLGPKSIVCAARDVLQQKHAGIPKQEVER